MSSWGSEQPMANAKVKVSIRISFWEYFVEMGLSQLLFDRQYKGHYHFSIPVHRVFHKEVAPS